MFKKIAIAAVLIAGTSSFASAEGDSTIGIYGPTGAQQYSAPSFTSRNVALGNGQYTVQGGYDRASSPSAGGGF